MTDDLRANGARLEAMGDVLASLGRDANHFDRALATWTAYAVALSILSTKLPASWFDEACTAGEAAARRSLGAPAAPVPSTDPVVLVPLRGEAS